jgi:nicotinamide-nucleotide amidase
MWAAALADGVLDPVLARAGAPARRVLRTWGVVESQFVPVLDAADPALREAVRVSVCARLGELEVVLRAPESEAGRLEALRAHLAERLGARLFSDDGRTVDEIVAERLRARGETLAVAESCTGGGLGARLTALPGSSAYLRGGVIAYADEVKTALLGVSPALIAREGAVSEACAREMALGARRAAGADWALSITGVAGPGGGTPAKPVGTVCLGIAGPDGAARALTRATYGDREGVRERSALNAMHLLREALGPG